ncbi:MAG TPA: hypothetical protein VM639_12935 [Dongiaceae bacterium]|nr:hypothetical protein [Dongiaceae bacterium]
MKSSLIALLLLAACASSSQTTPHEVVATPPPGKYSGAEQWVEVMAMRGLVAWPAPLEVQMDLASCIWLYVKSRLTPEQLAEFDAAVRNGGEVAPATGRALMDAVAAPIPGDASFLEFYCPDKIAEFKAYPAYPVLGPGTWSGPPAAQ